MLRFFDTLFCLCYFLSMKVAESTNTQNFGMKFSFTRMKTNLVDATRDLDVGFWNHSFQTGIIESNVKRLEPQDDEFVLRLGSPKYEFDRNSNMPMMEASYEMFVDIIDVKSKNKQTFNLSENGLQLEYLKLGNRLDVHSKGPFNKVLEFIDKLRK